ncbi:conserved hypothetical protein [Pediculus humanus corporis]|uniref:Dual oxidase maturation factor 1 n=1 Tax=Pediculus humanus subsp. corporis TaxID=121224 RepID=E0VBE3_PEDHC|nr:uncharacterized protein Phum_PHUM059450 [Pediculus humanus corporis]EEB10699.1 conserved hypothetical protein [Pediculus humanus corporis]
MKGWFDAFRNDGGPTLYSYSNRTPVTGDVNTISIILVFTTLLVAFLVIFPGIRKERFTTFLSVILSLYIGTVILVANNGSSWHVGVIKIVSTYRAYSPDRLHAELGAYIGLDHVNVTLKALPGVNRTAEDIDFNERFQWIGSHEMGTSYKQSLKKGLPFPILTVAEYLSQCQEGFNWGAHYRAAGYYASVTLWASFASWLMMNLLLIVVPRYGAYAMTTTGTLMLLSDFLYWYMIPPHELVVRLEESVLNFHFGKSFYLVLYSGILCLIVGLIITTIDTIFPHKFTTMLEVDYDTPYDRHIIIEDSQEEEEERGSVTGFGNKILRRLSKRGQLDGVGNEAFEMDPPKSPWRYPFRHTAFPEFNDDTRGQTRDNNSSDNGPVKSHINTSSRPPPLRISKYPFNRQISVDSQDSDHSTSSFGLSFLSKIRDSQRVPQSPLASEPTAGIHESRRSINQKSDVW